MTRHACAMLFSAILASHAAETPMPVRDEPHHKVVLENEHVRVIDVQIPAGKTTLYHVHTVPSVIVYLTKSTNSSQTWGGSATTSRSVSPGESRYAAYDEKPLAHRVTNTGTGPFRVLDIELIRTLPIAGSLRPAASLAVETRWEEVRVRSSVIKLEAGARCTVPPGISPYLLIVTTGAMGTSATKGSPASRELHPQDFVFFPPQTGFQVTATKTEEAEAVLLELK